MDEQEAEESYETSRVTVTGVLAFILASIEFWSFEKAVFDPLVDLLTRLL